MKLALCLTVTSFSAKTTRQLVAPRSACTDYGTERERERERVAANSIRRNKARREGCRASEGRKEWMSGATHFCEKTHHRREEEGKADEFGVGTNPCFSQ